MKKIICLSLVGLMIFSFGIVQVKADTGFATYINYSINGCFGTTKSGGSLYRNRSDQPAYVKVTSTGGSGTYFWLTGPGALGDGTSGAYLANSGSASKFSAAGAGYGFGIGTITSKVRSANVLSRSITGYWYATEEVYNILK